MQTTHALNGRYELGPVLGQGGMARVHRGRDRQLGRPVAVKILASPFDRDRAFVERFRREARAAAGLSHPNIVAVFDTGSDDGTHYIVTELVEGETLAERIRRDGPLAPGEAVAIAVDVCGALDAAHERGVVHRDVKPGNVMLTPDGTVKVVDFGIARAAGSDTLTGTGVVLGSTAYLSPEQASGEPGDARSDIYAFGCVLYEMLTGQVPFRADTPVATLYRHVNEDPPPPSSVAPVPPALEAIVMRCLSKDPRRRFGSAAELQQALRAAPLAGPSDTAPLAPVAADAAAETRPIAHASVGDGETRPIADAPVSARPPWYRRIPMRSLAVVGLIVLLALAALALASASDGLRPKQAAREARRIAAEEVPESTTPVSTAWTDLMDTIASETASEGIGADVSEGMVASATTLFEAYEVGDAAAVGAALGALEDELAGGVENAEVSPDAAAAIDLAMLELIGALDEEGALVEVLAIAGADRRRRGGRGGQLGARKWQRG